MLARALQARRIAQLLRCAPQRCITTIRDVTTIDALATIPCDQMITFSIVAHIDHGKSSLSQRLLEHCGNIDAAAAVGQDALDTLAVERERGITVKAVSASMVHDYEGRKYLVNLVDTPGHADFAHEVVRSLGACDGALLLVDAAQGVEAQTLKVADAARAAGVPLLAACSKVDLPTANAVDVASAPPRACSGPRGSSRAASATSRRGLRGVGTRVGDTLVADSEAGADAAPLPGGVAPSAPALYASVFPPDGAAFDDMAKAVERLAVNDASVSIAREPPRASLGLGLRLGFLGLLHLDVFRQRLRDEFAEALFTAPLVPYRVRWRDGTTTELATLDDWPSAEEQRAAVDAILEPSVTVDVAAPRDHLGAVLEVLENARGAQRSLDVDGDRAAVAYDAPWALVDVALNGVAVDALAFAAARGEAQRRGRAAAARLKAVVPRQLFEVVIQARVGTKSLARERLPPLRKDVLTTKAGKNVGGGDVTRKKKLLEKQKKGKAKQKTIGNVSLGQDALWAVVRSG
ncbi:GTPase [Aureococcus anophagefferens]|nr:GTPase [Aureococcus anophagefferens]